MEDEIQITIHSQPHIGGGQGLNRFLKENEDDESNLEIPERALVDSCVPAALFSEVMDRSYPAPLYR